MQAVIRSHDDKIHVNVPSIETLGDAIAYGKETLNHHILSAMKLDTFNRLPLDQKTSYMWDHGVCLAQRIIENRYILCIFEVNGFFVEAIYSRRNNRVNAILPIADIPQWEGYVDQVLTNLLKLN
jgi:hypothetical protein